MRQSDRYQKLPILPPLISIDFLPFSENCGKHGTNSTGSMMAELAFRKALLLLLATVGALLELKQPPTGILLEDEGDSVKLDDPREANGGRSFLEL